MHETMKRYMSMTQNPTVTGAIRCLIDAGYAENAVAYLDETLGIWFPQYA